MDYSNCAVCVEPFNKNTRKQVPCPFNCDFQVCATCFETHQTNQSGMFEISCMSCKQPWEDQHVRANVSHTLVKRLSQSTQKRLRDEEIAFMPETQMYVEYGRAVETVKVEEYLNIIRKKNDVELNLATHGITVVGNKTPADKKFKSDTQEELRLVENHASDIRFQISRWRNGMHLSRLFKDIIPELLYAKEFGTQPAALGLGEERESSVMCPCPANECRGFVTHRNHQCGVCGVKVCHRCLQTEEGEDQEDRVHTCDEEHVKSAELILATTKPCPKCASRIHKIEGCDQMWCTNCNTPFSWTSGKEIVGQTVHNPHFYEWMRQHPRPQAEEEEEGLGFNNCEGLPDAQNVILYLDVVFRHTQAPTRTFVRVISDTYRKCVHLRDVEITRDLDVQFRTNLDIRVQWLQNEITDAKFEQTLLRRHNQRVVKQHTNKVYGLVVTLCSDVFHRLLRVNENTKQIRESYMKEIEEIFKYANTCLYNIEQMYKVDFKNIYFII